MKMSSATKRALERNYYQSCEWFCDFKESDVEGIGYEPGVHRRRSKQCAEMSAIYIMSGIQNLQESMWDSIQVMKTQKYSLGFCDIWYAVSKDGYKWEEKGIAVARGEKGEYDDRSVFTPEVLEYEGKYYLVYQVVQHPYVNRSFENIAIAVADSPDGPFVKSKAPILEPTKDGIWDGEEDNRFAVKKKGSFDSHKVHDPILFPFKGKFYLYYKGEPMGEELYMGGRETKWGVAIADDIMGLMSKVNTIRVTNSGMETCLWKYNGGIADISPYGWCGKKHDPICRRRS